MVAKFSHSFLALPSRTSFAYLSICNHKKCSKIMLNDSIDSAQSTLAAQVKYTKRLKAAHCCFCYYQNLLNQLSWLYNKKGTFW